VIFFGSPPSHYLGDMMEDLGGELPGVVSSHTLPAHQDVEDLLERRQGRLVEELRLVRGAIE